MSNCLDRGGTGQAIRGAGDGLRFMAAAGGVEMCGGGRSRCAARGDSEPGRPPGEWLRRAKVAALWLLFVLVGWPALLFIDSALEVLLAYAI